MGKKFGIRKLVKGSSSKTGKGVVTNDSLHERWEAFESKLAERMKAKSVEPPQLNESSGADATATAAPQVTFQENQPTSRELSSPTSVVGRSASLRPSISPKQTPPMSPNGTTSLVDFDQPSPTQTPVSPQQLPTSSFSTNGSRRRANSSDCEASFSSGIVKVVPTSKSSDTDASKATLNTTPNSQEPTKSPLQTQLIAINKTNMPSQRYNWRTNSIHSYQGSTDSSSHGYSTSDSYTYATKDTHATKDTWYTYNTLNDENVSGLERAILRVASMFVCEAPECQSTRRH